MMCAVISHNGHKCSDVTSVEDEFRQQMATDCDNIATGVEKCREMLQKLEKEEISFYEQITKAATEFSRKAEQLKKMIDEHKEKLMDELATLRQGRMKEIDSLREKIERQKGSMKKYKKFVDALRKKGTAGVIARAANGLHDRADELLTFDVTDHTIDHLGHAEVTFTSSVSVGDQDIKTPGQLATVKTG